MDLGARTRRSAMSRAPPMSALARSPKPSTTMAACVRRRANESPPPRRPSAIGRTTSRKACIGRASMTVGILSNDSFGRFAFPIVEALERRLFDHGIAVFMCNATDDPVRERRHIDQLLGKRVDGLVVTARRADRRGRSNHRARLAGRLCVLAGREPRRALPAAGRRGRRKACRQPSRHARPQEDRAYHRPGAVRGGSPARNGLAKGAGRGGAEGGRWRLPARPLVRSLGTRGGASSLRPPSRDAGRALLRQRSDRARRCRCAARDGPRRAGRRGRGRLRQLGRDGGGGAAARSPAST